jgi:micrococcal nuclease
VDGDTIIVSINGKDERVRLIGVDTPESVHPDAERNIEYGKIASDYSKKRLEGKSVGLEFDVQERDKYGRLLAYVYLDGKMFNRELLEKGHAKIMTYPPNVRYANEFTALQAAARKKKVGVWAYEDTAGESAEIVSRKDAKFIGNVDTLKFHLPTCRYAVDLQDYKAAFFSKRTDAVDAGYEACGVCKP